MTYDFKCNNKDCVDCDIVQEVILGMNDSKDDVKCPNCGFTMERIFSPFAVGDYIGYDKDHGRRSSWSN